MIRGVLELGPIGSLGDAVNERSLREGLARFGFDPGSVIVRGGFDSDHDVALLLEHGTDYFGRPHLDRTGAHYHRERPDTTFAGTVSDATHPLAKLNPLWFGLDPRRPRNLLAVYDASCMEKTSALAEYAFKADPREALIGVLELRAQIGWDFLMSYAQR